MTPISNHFKPTVPSIVTIKLPDIVGRNATGTFETQIASKVKMMPSRCESTLCQSVRKYRCHCAVETSPES